SKLCSVRFFIRKVVVCCFVRCLRLQKCVVCAFLMRQFCSVRIFGLQKSVVSAFLITKL
ncbi:hypothetical protein K443DRAFT_117895, partial [Laccaria amethystina LaAM-08-1]